MKLQDLASLGVDKGSAVILRLNSYTGVAVKTPQSLILIDPGIHGHSLQGQLRPDIILVSHSHAGHFFPADIASLASENTKVLGTWRVIYALKKASFKHSSNLIALSPGNSIAAGDTDIEVHRALHPDISMAPAARERSASTAAAGSREQHLSFALTLRGLGKIYHMVDSAPSPELEKARGVEMAILPLNLNPWNSVREAAAAAEALKPRTVLALSNTEKRGILNRLRARRELTRFKKELRRRGAEAAFLTDTPYTYTGQGVTRGVR